MSAPRLRPHNVSRSESFQVNHWQAPALHVLPSHSHHCRRLPVAGGDRCIITAHEQSRSCTFTRSTLMAPCSAELCCSRGALRASANAGDAHSPACSVNYWRHPCHGLRRLLDISAVASGDGTFHMSFGAVARSGAAHDAFSLLCHRLKRVAGSAYQLVLLLSGSAAANMWCEAAAAA